MTAFSEFLSAEIDAGSFPGASALVGTSEAVLEEALVRRKNASE